MESVCDDQERFCATPKLPLFSIPLNRTSCETPGLATPPVNIAGSVPFIWEEAPGKPRVSDENKPPVSKENAVRCLDLPPRLVLPAVVNDPSPTTVLYGPYVVPRRSLSLTRRSEKDTECRFDFSRSTNGRCCDGGDTTVKIKRVRRNGSFMNLSHSKSQFLWLKKTRRKALFTSLEKMKEELMLIGLYHCSCHKGARLISEICANSSLFAPNKTMESIRNFFWNRNTPLLQPTSWNT